MPMVDSVAVWGLSLKNNRFLTAFWLVVARYSVGCFFSVLLLTLNLYVCSSLLMLMDNLLQH